MIRHIHDVDINNVHYKVIDTDLDSYKKVENLIKRYGHHYQFQPLIITTQLTNTYSNPYFNTFILSKEYSYNDALKLAYNDYCSAIFKDIVDNDTGIRH